MRYQHDDAYDDMADEGPGLDDREMPNASDVDDDDDTETISCPHCRNPVYENAERCPRCGRYLSEEDAPHRRRPWWIVAGVIVCLAIILLAWVLAPSGGR